MAGEGSHLAPAAGNFTIAGKSHDPIERGLWLFAYQPLAFRRKERKCAFPRWVGEHSALL
jgi:hypothetical protein